MDSARNGYSEFAAAAAKIDQKQWPTCYPSICQHAQVNQTPFFNSGNDFRTPAGGGLNPLCKTGRISRITKCTGGNYPDGVDANLSGRPMEATQHLYGLIDRFGIEQS